MKIKSISVGILFLASCSSHEATKNSSGGESPPAESGDQGNRIPSLSEPGKTYKSCASGQTYWAEECYDELHIDIVGVRDCSKISDSSEHDKCLESKPTHIQTSLVKNGRSEILYTIGEKPTPLLLKETFKIDDKFKDIVRWYATGSMFSFDIATSRENMDDLSKSTIRSFRSNGFDTGFSLNVSPVVSSEPFLLGGFASCPSRGQLSLNGLTLALPATEEEFAAAFNDIFHSESRKNKLWGISYDSEKVKSDLCLRAKETTISELQAAFL